MQQKKKAVLNENGTGLLLTPFLTLKKKRTTKAEKKEKTETIKKIEKCSIKVMFSILKNPLKKQGSF